MTTPITKQPDRWTEFWAGVERTYKFMSYLQDLRLRARGDPDVYLDRLAKAGTLYDGFDMSVFT